MSLLDDLRAALHDSRSETLARGHTWDVADAVDAVRKALAGFSPDLDHALDTDIEMWERQLRDEPSRDWRHGVDVSLCIIECGPGGHRRET